MCPFKGEYPKSSACMHTVHEFVTLSFKKVGVELCWEGEGVNEKGIDVKTGRTQVEIDINIFVLVRLSSCWEILWKPRRSRYYWGGEFYEDKLSGISEDDGGAWYAVCEEIVSEIASCWMIISISQNR